MQSLLFKVRVGCLVMKVSFIVYNFTGRFLSHDHNHNSKLMHKK